MDFFVGYSAAEGRRQRKRLLADIDRDFETKFRANARGKKAKVVQLRAEKRDAVAKRRGECKVSVSKVRDKARARFKRAVEKARARWRSEVLEARQRCRALIEGERFTYNAQIIEAAADWRTYVEEHRREKGWERWGKNRKKDKRTIAERVQESDDEVRANIEPHLLPLWERSKRSIKGSGRMTRTEAFLHFAGEHPDEVLAAQEAEVEAELAREILAEQKRVEAEMALEGQRLDLAEAEAEIDAAPKSRTRKKRGAAHRELMEFFGSLVIAG
jgi:hypothetical protein